MSKTLEVLNGTDYWVEVERDVPGYEVTLYKPGDTTAAYFIEPEVVGSRYTVSIDSVEGLTRIVTEMMELDKPSLVGTYRGEANGDRDE